MTYHSFNRIHKKNIHVKLPCASIDKDFFICNHRKTDKKKKISNHICLLYLQVFIVKYVSVSFLFLVSKINLFYYTYIEKENKSNHINILINISKIKAKSKNHSYRLVKSEICFIYDRIPACI